VDNILFLMDDVYQAVVDSLLRANVNFLAIDFDNTLVCLHTSGMFSDTSTKLAEYFRPCFRKLIPRAIDHNINVCVVTFSPQGNLIKEAIRIVFPLHGDRIIVRAKDNTWGDMGTEKKHGKQKYIASAAEFAETEFKVKITRKTTLLIDDQQSNINIALSNSVPALLFNPENPDSMVTDIIEFSRYVLRE
jgi:hypothetical protein